MKMTYSLFNSSKLHNYSQKTLRQSAKWCHV